MEINVADKDFNTITIIDASGREETFDLAEELRIQEGTLQDDLMTQPAKYAYWSSLLTTLQYYEEVAEKKLETISAKLDIQVRLELSQPNSVVKPTKDSVIARVTSNEEYQTAWDEELQYTHLVKRVNHIVRSFEQRSDMLRSVSRQILESQFHSTRTFNQPQNTGSQAPPLDGFPNVGYNS